jgi:hypothetical protein
MKCAGGDFSFFTVPDIRRILFSKGGLASRLPSGKPFFLFTAPSAMTKTDYP